MTGIAFSILFLRNKSCFYIVSVDESDLQRDKVAKILHNFVWYIYKTNFLRFAVIMPI